MRGCFLWTRYSENRQPTFFYFTYITFFTLFFAFLSYPFIFYIKLLNQILKVINKSKKNENQGIPQEIDFGRY